MVRGGCPPCRLRACLPFGPRPPVMALCRGGCAPFRRFAMKTRQAFYLHTTKLTRIARRLCREILRPWHAARHPYLPINSAAIKAEFLDQGAPFPSGAGVAEPRKGSQLKAQAGHSAATRSLPEPTAVLRYLGGFLVLPAGSF
ncbi:hypothetical protein P7K49_018782 [Saguinus oedipus]|uniref:Metastasis-associated protein MTA1 R1 domain-containing protein n=1 Tax=Saguinus oedipus TaxID=9490 RepID=A0ABQ9V6R2_SAGOE|nr:hypothetical protein P7K49_018782 [Saguinus oedipus]